MTVSHQQLVFNISLAPAPAQTTTLGTIALIAPNQTLAQGGGRYETFYSYTEMVDAGITGAALNAGLVAFSQPRKPTLILVNQDLAGTETVVAAYTAFRALQVKHFAVALTSRTPADQLALAAFVETVNFRVGAMFQTDEAVGSGWPVALAAIEDNIHSGVVYSDDDTEYHDIAALANRLTFNWDATAPSFRGSLGGVQVANDLTPGQLATAKAAGINVVAPFGTSGTYFADGLNAEGRPYDEVFAIYWFVDRLEALLQKTILSMDARGQKIPIDATGQNILKAAITAQFNLGVSAGHFKEDQIEIVMGDLATDLSNLTISATVNITETRGAKGFVLNLNFTTDDVVVG
jgi:hypothetical protein